MSADKEVVIILQCHIVMERCGGYFCERAITHREDAFARYPKQQPLRHVMLTCGGCCGRATQRKICNYLNKLKQKEGIDRSRVVVHLATCITQASYHGPKCPHLDYLRELLARLEIEVRDDTHLSKTAVKRRAKGMYE